MFFSKFSKVIVEILTNIAPGRLTQSKRICIKELVDSKLFKMPECREILLPVFCQQIKDKLESKEEVRTLFIRIDKMRDILIIVCPKSNIIYHNSAYVSCVCVNQIDNAFLKHIKT